MDKDQKQKLDRLKQKAKIKAQKQRLENNALLQECLAALGDYKLLEDEKEIGSIIAKASSPDVEMYSHDDQVILEDALKYYIVWDEASLPVIITYGKIIMENWDDVMAVSFETYFVSVSSGKVIGIRH